MIENKAAAQMLQHPNGQKRELSQTHGSIIHQQARHFKRLAAKLTLTACGIVLLASIVGIAEGSGFPAACYTIGSVLAANHAAGELLEEE